MNDACASSNEPAPASSFDRLSADTDPSQALAGFGNFSQHADIARPTPPTPSSQAAVKTEVSRSSSRRPTFAATTRGAQLTVAAANRKIAQSVKDGGMISFRERCDNAPSGSPTAGDRAKGSFNSDDDSRDFEAAFLNMFADEEAASAAHDRLAAQTEALPSQEVLTSDVQRMQSMQHLPHPPHSFHPWQGQLQAPANYQPRMPPVAPAPVQAVAAAPHYLYYHQHGDLDASQFATNSKAMYSFDQPYPEARKEACYEHPLHLVQPTSALPVKKNQAEMMPRVVAPHFAYRQKRRHQESEPRYMTRFDILSTGDLASSPTAPPFYTNPLLVGVPLVMTEDPTRVAKDPAYKRHKAPTPLDPRTIPYLGKSKVSRLARLGVLTVEDLASVNPDDRLFAVAATKNNRSDHAKRTLQKWKVS